MIFLTVQLDFSTFTLCKDDDIATQINHGKGVSINLRFTSGQEAAQSRL